MALRSGLLRVNGADLAYELAGVGRPLVFLHGHLVDIGQWDDQMTTFAATNRVLRYDARGYGRSSLPPGPFAHHMTVRLFARPPIPDSAPQPLDPPTATRLGEIRPPTLVLVGAEDQPAIHAIADRLCADIPHARKIVIPDAGHHPNLEQPGLFDQLLRQFVGGIAAV